jgi:hypothetical protein
VRGTIDKTRSSHRRFFGCVEEFSRSQGQSDIRSLGVQLLRLGCSWSPCLLLWRYILPAMFFEPGWGALPQVGCQTKARRIAGVPWIPDSHGVCNVQIWHAHFMNGVLRGASIINRPFGCESIRWQSSIQSVHEYNVPARQMAKVEMQQSDTLNGMDPRSSILSRYISPSAFRAICRDVQIPLAVNLNS